MKADARFIPAMQALLEHYENDFSGLEDSACPLCRTAALVAEGFDIPDEPPPISDKTCDRCPWIKYQHMKCFYYMREEFDPDNGFTSQEFRNGDIPFRERWKNRRIAQLRDWIAKTKGENNA